MDSSCSWIPTRAVTGAGAVEVKNEVGNDSKKRQRQERYSNCSNPHSKERNLPLSIQDAAPRAVIQKHTFN